MPNTKTLLSKGDVNRYRQAICSWATQRGARIRTLDAADLTFALARADYLEWTPMAPKAKGGIVRVFIEWGVSDRPLLTCMVGEEYRTDELVRLLPPIVA